MQHWTPPFGEGVLLVLWGLLSIAGRMTDPSLRQWGSGLGRDAVLHGTVPTCAAPTAGAVASARRGLCCGHSLWAVGAVVGGWQRSAVRLRGFGGLRM